MTAKSAVKKIALIALVAGSMCGQNKRPAQKAADPGGWTKAKWNMTERQIAGLFPEASEIVEKYGLKYLGVEHYRIGNYDYTVTFSFRGPGLEGVTIKPEEKGPPSAVAQFEKLILLEMLTDKYGPPTTVTEDREEHGDGSTKKWQWLFPATRITLYWTAYSEPDFKHLDETDVIYSRRDKQDAL